MTSAKSEDLQFAEPRAAAGVLFRNDAGEILMVYPTYKDYLDIPGGYVEPGETPRQAARREVREEISLDVQVGQLLVVDYWLSSPEESGREKILFIFDGGVLSPDRIIEICVDNVEIGKVGFHSVLRLSDLTIRRLSNRLAHAMHAVEVAATVYLENGE